MSIGDSNFGVQVGLGFIGRIVTALVAFVGSVFLARFLGPENYGSFYILLAIVSFFDNPVTGWAVACRKRLTEVDSSSEQIVGSLLLGILVASILSVVIAVTASKWITNFTGDPNSWMLLIILYIGMIVYVSSLEVLKATDKFGRSTWIQAVRDIIRVTVQSGLVIVGFGVGGMVGGIIFANLILAPSIFYFIGPSPALPSRNTLNDIWAYGRSSIPDGLLSTAQERIDIMILGILASTSVVGNYEVALKITLPAIFVAGVASNGLMGRISNRRSKDLEVANEIQRNIAYASLIAVPLFFGAITIGGPVVVTLYSSQYSLAGGFIGGLALFRLIRSQKAILISSINGLNKPNLNLRVSALEFLLNVFLGIGLYFVIGPLGVIIATVLSELLAYIYRAFIIKQLVPTVDFLPQPLKKQFASGVLMAILVYIARHSIGLKMWYDTILVVGMGCGVYFVSLLYISESFRETSRAIARDAGII